MAKQAMMGMRAQSASKSWILTHDDK